MNAKNGTSYGPETPLVHGVQSWERHTADRAGDWLTGAFHDFMDDEEPGTRRIALAAMRQALDWLEKQEGHNAP